MDGNCSIDLAAACEYYGTICILHNNGDGTFTRGADFSAEGRPQTIFAADLYLDGDNDLAIANFYSDDVSVLLNLTITEPSIPALSQWGMIIMALLLLAAGTVLVVRKKQRMNIS